MRNIIIAVVVIALLVVGYFAFFGKKTTNNNSSSSSGGSSSSNQASSDCPGAPSASETVTVTYTSSGFSPSIVSVKKGGTLTVKNSSGNSLQFDSNPHPVHTDDEELNIGMVADGSEKTATLNNTGCFGFHNHFSPSQEGKILIK